MRSARRSLAALATAAILLASLYAQAPQPSGKERATTQEKAQPQCTNNGTYVNKSGNTVKRPETCSAAPAGATAMCRDGSYSFSQSHRGTCSHHGGVAKWL